ncbi:polyprenol monophosphomannose synthase [Corynebacterium auris]|uniref:polyprenol monophosphomannose synthase n=1 Tax=Corynebacterium auris TaxID=44750 RepID=UPI0025B3294A|nr:polyprenol monophosphomannose synthase [Corynebacterium auris]WJY68029.1 Undecaprenyl-phosphate mannosyltransferase [Corynebacterium auris]
MANTTVVIIPTYNEVDNLPLIVDRVLSSTPEVDVLVVDDNSPDGTGAKADELAGAHPEVHVLHRGNKEGLLAAYREGFEWALERDYEVICQMDADGSHAPEELELLLGEIEAGADVVIGSRYVEGGQVDNWPRERYMLSKWGNRYISLALGDDVEDMTAGYRAFRREVLESIDLSALSTKGYIFQVDMIRKALEAEFDVREVPITFVDRQLGQSKLDSSFASESLLEVTKWGAERQSAFLRELARETGKLLRHEVDQSGLWKTRRVVGDVTETGVNMVLEGAKLAGHELKRSGVSAIPRRAARAADTAVEFIREAVRVGTSGK